MGNLTIMFTGDKLATTTQGTGYQQEGKYRWMSPSQRAGKIEASLEAL